MNVPTHVRTVKTVDVAALYSAIGRAMKSARESRRMSQEQVGLALGMTRANVANLEAGRGRILVEHIYNAALFLKVPIRKLLP